jgi:general secretion pathway protein C
VPAQWLSNSTAWSERASAVLSAVLNTVAQPEFGRRLRQVLLYLLALWAVLALGRLFWSFLPSAEPAETGPVAVINPVSNSHAASAAAPVDIDRMVAWHLFGQAGAVVPAASEAPDAESKANARAGIENGAHETRLQLKLVGIVASTEDGLGYAVIEFQNQQAVYSVEDKLPVPGEVVLAKVMPRQVVLDNGGTYELLTLFEDSNLGIATSAVAAPPAPVARGQIDKRGDPQASSLATTYRDRLFKDPQSLAEVVSISAVREGEQLKGFRVSPGKDKEQFDQLGFKAGDVVTSVNGVSLDNPANTMALYNTMRTANEVVFELERDDQPLTLSVNLQAGATE